MANSIDELEAYHACLTRTHGAKLSSIPQVEDLRLRIDEGTAPQKEIDISGIFAKWILY